MSDGTARRVTENSDLLIKGRLPWKTWSCLNTLMHKKLQDGGNLKITEVTLKNQVRAKKNNEKEIKLIDKVAITVVSLV